MLRLQHRLLEDNENRVKKAEVRNEDEKIYILVPYKCLKILSSTFTRSDIYMSSSGQSYTSWKIVWCTELPLCTRPLIPSSKKNLCDM